MKNFVALDFETASGKNPCSIGLVEFENGKVIRQYYSLINPMIDKFNPFAQRIHGISKEEVENERNFQEIWDEIKHFIIDKTIVCHQSSTDISILKFSLEKYAIETPNFESICTLKLSRAFLKLENNKLNTVAEFFNVSQNNHHEALEDAFVCGKIFLRFLKEVKDVGKIKNIGSYIHKNKAKNNKSRYRINHSPDANIYQSPELENEWVYGIYNYNENKGKVSEKLEGLKFVISGVFSQFSRPELKKSIEDNGGKVSSAISKKTNYIIAGDNMGPSKRTKAETLGIPIISEADYLKMLKNKNCL